MKTQLFAGALFVLAALPASALGVRLALEPSDLPRANWPVTSGVPFAQGALPEAAHLTLLDAAGGDYSTIAKKNFRGLVVERDGQPVMVDRLR